MTDYEMPGIVARPGDKVTPDESHFQNGNLKRNRVLYLNALYSIEMLKVVDPTNLNPYSTYMYGKDNNAPWIPEFTEFGNMYENGELMRKFMHQYGDHIVKYHVAKFSAVVNKLQIWAQELSNQNEFLMTPMEPAVVNSIVTELTDFVGNGDPTKIRSVPAWAKDNYQRSRRRITSLENITVADRVIRGVFDTYSGINRSHHTEENLERYGHQKAEILDDKIYLCHEKVLRCLTNLPFDSVCYPSWGMDNAGTNFKAMADILSILFRLFIPKGMHPCSLSSMYEKILRRHNVDYPAALNEVRKFSAYPPEAVLDIHLPELPCKCLVREYLDKVNVVDNLHLGSMVEEYMVTQWFADKL